MPQHHQYAIVACARWENEYLAEWLLYHRRIGFDHVYLYCNDDDPAACTEALLPFLAGPEPFVTLVHYPFVGLQAQMYKHFLRYRIREVGWFIFLDVDEFLVFRQHGTVRNFLAAHGDAADMVFLNWLIFGHCGYKRRPPGSVLLNYTRRAAHLHHFTKCLTRAASLDAAAYVAEGVSGFWHTWNFWDERLNRVVNAIGDDMSGYFAKGQDAVHAWFAEGEREARIMAAAVIHHYQFRAEDEIERRLRRGTEGDFIGQRVFAGVLETNTLAEFLAPFSAVEDTSLCDYWRYVTDQGRAVSLLTRPSGWNVARGKPATQSSISQWSRGATPEEDAAGVISGTFTGSYNCHTAEEDDPWWQVDLLYVHEIRQIQVFNRVDTETFRARASLFSLETSTDGENWEILHRTEKPLPFGGTDGQPLIWSSATPRSVRFVRFRLLTHTILHLEAVEIYEEAYEPFHLDPAAYGPVTERIIAAGT